jgi:hypothetical protein
MDLRGWTFVKKPSLIKKLFLSPCHMTTVAPLSSVFPANQSYCRTFTCHPVLFLLSPNPDLPVAVFSPSCHLVLSATHISQTCSKCDPVSSQVSASPNVCPKACSVQSHLPFNLVLLITRSCPTCQPVLSYMSPVLSNVSLTFILPVSPVEKSCQTCKLNLSYQATCNPFLSHQSH